MSPRERTSSIQVERRGWLPPSLAGRTIAGAQLRQKIGCSVVALENDNGESVVSPPPETVLEEGVTLTMIGSPEQEEQFDAVLSGA